MDIGDWVSPRAGLDVVEKRKILPLPGFELSIGYPDWFFSFQVNTVVVS
jgi:hypothetical protein